MAGWWNVGGLILGFWRGGLRCIYVQEESMDCVLFLGGTYLAPGSSRLIAKAFYSTLLFWKRCA
jgi:hypothetical protein